MKVTPVALNEIKKILENEESPLTGIRIFAQQGCCGPALQMSVSHHVSPGDKLVSMDSVTFYIEPVAEEMLEGVNIDYSPNGFRLEGMKKTGSCCS